MYLWINSLGGKGKTEENQKKKKKIPTIIWWLLVIVFCAGFFLGPTIVANIKEERYSGQVAEVEAVKETWLQD